MLASFLSGEFLLNIPCWLHFYVGSFSYTSHADFFMWGVCLTHPELPSLCFFFGGGVLLHIPCWLHFYLGSFSYTCRAGFISVSEVYVRDPMLDLLFRGGFLLHIPCWLLFLNLGSFSYTSRAGFIFIWVGWGVLLNDIFIIGGHSLTHTVLVYFHYWGTVSYRAGFLFIRTVSLTHPKLASFLTHPVMALFLCVEFLLHIPCWL